VCERKEGGFSAFSVFDVGVALDVILIVIEILFFHFFSNFLLSDVVGLPFAFFLIDCFTPS
jgi:hypothetical protein